MTPDALVDHLFRRQAGQMVATLTRHLGARHLALAEDAVQEALVKALQQWPFRGVPDHPEGWLFRTARNAALDRLRHERVAAHKAPALAHHLPREAPPASDATLAGEPPPLDDDRLGLMFLACHPALSRESRVALTLKLVGGFSVREIARAYLAQDAAVAQRLVRARHQLRAAEASFGPPEAADLADRLDAVLEAIYLIFNEGYAATEGDALVREDIAAEAIRQARLVAAHPVTDVPRAWALVALLELHAARFPARMGEDGTIFRLRDQDRSRWDRRLIASGMRALDRAAGGADVSRYHLEAGLAACHAAAPTWDATDWRHMLDLYDDLLALTGSPIVALNRAVVVAQIEGPRAGLAALDAIRDAPGLARYHLFHAAKAELWREAGDPDRASAAYRDALEAARSAPERRFLAERLEQL
ncbi:MAG: DUF6596 domain-containing protein [Acidobacteriota bacterium]